MGFTNSAVSIYLLPGTFVSALYVRPFLVDIKSTHWTVSTRAVGESSMDHIEYKFSDAGFTQF